MILMTGCTTLQRSKDDIFVDFEGKYIDSPSAREAFASRHSQVTSRQPLFFDASNRQMGTTVDVNRIYSKSLQRYLENVIKRLLDGHVADKPDVKIVITDSMAFSPSATPYNEILIPLGMLLNATSDDEIAALLAHELSHILLHHFKRAEEMMKQTEMLNSWIELSTQMAQFTAIKLKPNVMTGLAVQHGMSSSARNVLSDAQITTNLIQEFSDTVWNSAWQRGQEEQADYLAADLLVRAGYSLRGMRNALRRLESFQGQQKTILNLFEDRQEALASELKKLLNNETNRFLTGGHVDLLNDAKQEGMEFLQRSTITAAGYVKDKLSRSHLESEERLSLNRDYWRKAYRLERRRSLSTRKIKIALSKRDSLNVIKANGLAFNAKQAISEGNYQTAEKLLRKAVSLDSTSPGPRYAFSLLRKAQNKQYLALKNLQLIRNWDDASLSAHREIVSLLLIKGRNNEALTYLTKAERHGWKEDFAYDKLSALYKSRKLMAANNAYQQCLSYKNVRNKCMQDFGFIFN